MRSLDTQMQMSLNSPLMDLMRPSQEQVDNRENLNSPPRDLTRPPQVKTLKGLPLETVY